MIELIDNPKRLGQVSCSYTPPRSHRCIDEERFVPVHWLCFGTSLKKKKMPQRWLWSLTALPWWVSCPAPLWGSSMPHVVVFCHSWWSFATHGGLCTRVCSVFINTMPMSSHCPGTSCRREPCQCRTSASLARPHRARCLCSRVPFSTCV